MLEPVIIEPGVTLKFPDVEKFSGTILTLSEVSYRYSEESRFILYHEIEFLTIYFRIIFSNVDLSATMQSRICIVGENGAGKTTLLKIIMEMIDPSKGTRVAHRNLKFGYFTQVWTVD